MTDLTLRHKYGVTMARYPNWCIKYKALKNVPVDELENAITIRGTIEDRLRTTKEYIQLLRYCLKRNAELINMYVTDGERSIDNFRKTHYHAVIVKDNTRIRLFYDFHSKNGHIRGWTEHYIYQDAVDIIKLSL